MPPGFTVKIVVEAAYRLVPEDSAVGAGINVPYRAGDARLAPDARMDLRADGWAEYGGGVLERVHVPEGWRLESWDDVTEAERSTFEEVAETVKRRRR